MYGSIITQTGEAALNQAAVSGENVSLTHVVIGDGNGNPVEPSTLYGLTAIPGEVYRAAITAWYPDPDTANQMIIETILPVDVGGFTIRAVGVVDTDDRLIVAGNFPETPKPTIAEGAVDEIRLQVVVATSHTGQITIVVNQSQITASQDYVNMVVWNHENKTDPHQQYLTKPEGDTLYDPLGIAVSERANHEATPDPHQQYLKKTGHTPSLHPWRYFFSQI